MTAPTSPASNQKKSVDQNFLASSLLILLNRWIHSNDRVKLLRWSAGYFAIAALIFIGVGTRYLSAYSFPSDIFSIVYTLSAFISHFASIALIAWVLAIFPLTLLFPFKKVILPLCILIVSFITCLILLDSQLYTAHRFHFTLLTIKIMGWKTWGFGIIYMIILLVFTSFATKLTWEHFVVNRKKVHITLFTSIIIALLLFTHAVHILADATGIVNITRFTTTLPLFYPTTDKKTMTKYGFANISGRRDLPSNFGNAGGNFSYPLNPLSFSPAQPHNILLICIDDLRGDKMTETLAPNCMRYSSQYGVRFTNHWSGGNSTKMGMFSLFYGIPPTYQQYMQSIKQSPVLIDRFQECNYPIGIFTSYKLYAPAELDMTAFAKIPNLRLETKLEGENTPWRADSSITAEWQTWLDKNSVKQPFFGFLFYDALSNESYPPSYASRIKLTDRAPKLQCRAEKYSVSVQYVDSLIGIVLDDLQKRGLFENTIVIITADHGEEYDDNKLGYTGHGSAYSKYQLQVPLIVLWPGKEPSIIGKRTSHNDIIATLMKDALGCQNPESDYCSGTNLFTNTQWDWLITGSYYNFAIIEPTQTTVQFPGGFFEVRDTNYQILPRIQFSSTMTTALHEMGRFYNK